MTARNETRPAAPEPGQPSDLTVVRDRDAYAAIRGFVYQIDLTIQRWTRLDETDRLFPERGEDIDLVANWMNGGDDQLLEQVKSLSAPITLNTPAVRAALAGFHEHAVANPALRLRFRFATNARVSRERTSHFDRKEPGIQAWEAARTSFGPVPQTFIAGLRNTFKDAPKPDDLADQTWAHFIGFIKDAPSEAIAAYVRSIDFSYGLDHPTETRNSTIALLVSLGHVADPDVAGDAYLVLFHHVTRLLCDPPPRMLARADIASVLASNQARSERIASTLRLIESRVRILETGLDEQATRIARIETSLVLRDTTAADIAQRPPAPEHQIEREALVSTIASIAKSTSFVAVTGNPGMGKTQLLRLIAERLALPTAWLSLRDLSPPEVATRIGEVAELFRDERPPAVLVLDDMPALNYASEAVTNRLSFLLTSEQWRESRLLSSSTGVHSTTALAALGAGRAVAFPLPPLTDDEGAVLLARMGGRVDARGLQFLLEMTGRHPQMFVAVCRYLANSGWVLTDAVLGGLLAKRFTDGLTAETAERFIATVADASTRELVHRMRLCLTRLQLRQIHAVSRIDPRIPDPITRVAALDGVWLQREAAGAWALAPLIQCLPLNALDDRCSLACHEALANSYVEGNSVNVAQVRYILHHLREAGLNDRFATLFKQVVLSALSREYRGVAKGVLRTLRLTVFPTGIPEDQRLALVALQSAVALELGEKASSAELDDLANNPALSNDTKELIAVTVGVRIRDGRAIQLVGNGIIALGDSPHAELRRSRAVLLASLVTQLDSPASLESWLRLTDVLSDEECKQVEKQPLWAGGVLHGMSHAVENSPRAERLRLASSVREVAEKRAMPMLRAIGMRASALFHSDEDAPKAMIQLTADLEHFTATSRERGLLSAALVQVATHIGDAALSVRYATEALLCESEGIEYQIAQCALRGAMATQDPPEAIRFCEHSIRLSQESEMVPAGLLIRAQGDLGITQWRAGKRSEAIRSLVACADRLLSTDGADPDWRELIPICVAVLNHVAAAMRGVQLTTEDGRSYDPSIGVFFKADEASAATYTDDKPLVVAALVVGLSTYVNETSASERAVAILADKLQTASPVVRLVVAINAGAYLASKGLLSELVSSAWLSIAAPRANDLASLPADWDQRDQSVLLFAVAPCTLAVCLGFLSRDALGRERLADFCAALRDLDGQGSKARWGDFAQYLEKSVAPGTPLSVVTKSVYELKNSVLESCVMLLSVFHPQTRPEGAITAQVYTMPALWPMFEKEQDAAMLLFEPYLRGYWSHMATTQRFRFLRPAMIDADLADAGSGLTVAERVYAYLRVGLEQLGVHIRVDKAIFGL